jgi:hypothetical protein
MNFDFDIVMILALFTIGAVLIYAIVSRRRASSAQDHHEDAAVARRQRAEDAAVASGEARAEDFAETDGSNRNWSEERGANPPTPMPPRN